MKHSMHKALLGSGAVAWVIVVFWLAPFTAGQPRQDKAAGSAQAAGNAASGKKIYNQIGCWQCHGYSAQGGTAGPRLVPDLVSFEAFTGYIRAPQEEMPPYTEKVLSESKLADIYAFLKALPPPPKAKDIPLLNKKGN